MRRSPLILLALLPALLLVPGASGAGPWLGTAAEGLGYTAVVRDGATTVAGESGSLTLRGAWGLPRVTLNGEVGGLSADGRVLVLGERFSPTGELRPESSFTVVRTNPPRVTRTVTLRGDFGFDALSPHGRWLYLIQHVSARNLLSYRVRAYDLAHGRLLARVVADKRQRDWVMEGYPLARAAAAGGRWVYTLYGNGNNYPFVHALDTVSRTAVCIGLPWDWTADRAEIDRATLTVEGGKLAVGDRFLLDRATFRVTKR